MNSTMHLEELKYKVGNTPLIELEDLWGGLRLWAKLEWHNPFGSLKDRAALWMIREAERRGMVKKGSSILIEPTSGNTGIALAGIARQMGYDVELVVPMKVSSETKEIIRALGAELLETEDDLCPRVGKGTDQSIALAKAIVKSQPDRYYMPNQYDNDANFMAHYESTGPEIWEGMKGEIDYLIAGIGTGGTITGAGTFLKEKNPAIKLIAVTPQPNHHIQGLRNLKESSMPPLLERRVSIIDEWVEVSDDEAFRCVKLLAEERGLLVGPSSGAVLAAALRLRPKGKGVLIFGDDGRKFRSLYKEFSVLSDEDFEALLKKGEYLPQNPLAQLLQQ